MPRPSTFNVEAEAIYRHLDGQKLKDGGGLAAALFKTYQTYYSPTIPMNDFARLMKIGLKRGWVIDHSESGQGCSVQMPAVF